MAGAGEENFPRPRSVARMSSLHTTETTFLDDELQMRPLLGNPPRGFDCGSAEQNAFLYERAWNDARCGITATHLLYVKGMLAAYVTVMADRIKLGSRERPRGVDTERRGRTPDRVPVSLRFDLRERAEIE